MPNCLHQHTAPIIQTIQRQARCTMIRFRCLHSSHLSQILTDFPAFIPKVNPPNASLRRTLSPFQLKALKPSPDSHDRLPPTRRSLSLHHGPIVDLPSTEATFTSRPCLGRCWRCELSAREPQMGNVVPVNMEGVQLRRRTCCVEDNGCIRQRLR